MTQNLQIDIKCEMKQKTYKRHIKLVNIVVNNNNNNNDDDDDDENT